MEAIRHITDEEREKCRRVADAFAELYDLTDTIVLDAKQYGFVMLQYYRESGGFEVIVTFTDSRRLFEELWRNWFEEQLLILAKGTPLEDLEYEEVFARLSRERQDEIMSKKGWFESKAGLRF